MSHSIRVLVAASTQSEMSESLAGSPTKLLLATNLVDCLLLALLGEYICSFNLQWADHVDLLSVRASPVDDSSVISDPVPLVKQLVHFMDVGRHIPSTHLTEAGIQKLICNSFAVLTEGSVRDHGFWNVVKQQTEFDQLLFSLLLDESRQPIRKEISENIALVCTPVKLLRKTEGSGEQQSTSPEIPAQVDILGTIWEAFVQILPQTLDHAHKSQEFFEVVLLVFRSVAEKPSRELRFDEYLKQWSTIMLGHQTQEVCSACPIMALNCIESESSLSDESS